MSINFLFRHGLSFSRIARDTGLDRRTVKRYALNPELVNRPRKAVVRKGKLTPYLPYLESWLAEDSGWRASRIYDRLVEMGFDGGRTIVRDAVRRIKERNSRIAYVRFETDPGLQAQVDYGVFKARCPDGVERTYYLFSMVLGYSRAQYAEFQDGCDLPRFLDAHQRAFSHFGGVPMEILYDRMRNVLVREGSAEGRFTQSLRTLAVHYGFVPRVAPAYAPWVKGKVERPMNFIREGFWRGYVFSGLASANRDVSEWLSQKSLRTIGITRESVAARYERERRFLSPLPPVACDISERLYRKVSRDCTISVEGVLYEVPHTLVGERVLVRMRDGVLGVYDGDALVASHAMPECKGGLVRLPGLRETVMADRAMNSRKWARPSKGVARAAVGPVAGDYEVEVCRRPLSVYREIGGDVSNA